MKIKVKCDNCRLNLFIFPSRLRTEKYHFCNRKCYGIWRSKNIKGINSPLHKRKMIVKCKFCNNIFKKHKSQTLKFCSRLCYGKWFSINKCGKNSYLYKEKIKTRCSCCNKLLYLSNWRKKRSTHNFCNRICQDNFFIGKNAYNYIHGESRLPYPMEFNEKLKEFIRRRDNYKCMNCGVTQKEMLRNIDVHHIDYNKKNIDTINLISLCNKCNIRANFNHKYWKNHYEQMQIDRKVHLLDMKLEIQLDLEEMKEWTKK